MKKTTLIIATLPILSIAVYYLFSADSNRDSSYHVADSPKAAHNDLRFSKSNFDSASDLHNAKLRKIQLSKEKAYEHLKEAGATLEKITPDIQKRMVERKLQNRTPAYKQLFNTWELDQNRANDVLNIIYEKEIESISLTMSPIVSDINSASDQIIDRTGARMSLESRTMTKLTALLGVERAKQLTELERKLKTNSSIQIAD